MKNLFLLLFLAFSVPALAQNPLGKLKKAVSKDSSSKGGVLQSVSQQIRGGGGSSLSSEEIINGLKEALSTGTVNTTQLLNKADGFFANEAIKILMPPEAKNAEKTLRNLGMGSMVDKAILSMNRAAEDAAGNVTEIFIDAIKGMTVSDGLKILRGGDFAATEYLKQQKTATLTERMRPVIEASLQKENATSYLNDVFKQ